MGCSTCKKNKAKANQQKVKTASAIRKVRPMVTSININGKKYKSIGK